MKSAIDTLGSQARVARPLRFAFLVCLFVLFGSTSWIMPVFGAAVRVHGEASAFLFLRFCHSRPASEGVVIAAIEWAVTKCWFHRKTDNE